MKINHSAVDFQPGTRYNLTMRSRVMYQKVLAALSDTPVIFLTGARQCGKSTLARSIAKSFSNSKYLTFDDLAVLSAARNDPDGFLASLPDFTILDEAQRLPELFIPMKAE